MPPSPIDNRQWLLERRPIGRAVAHDDFRLVHSPLGAPASGEVLVRTLYLAFEPGLKAQMENATNYSTGLNLGDVMFGIGLGQIIESHHAAFHAGDLVRGHLRWQEHICAKPADIGLEKADATVPLTANLSVLGSSGLAAYFGLFEIGKPVPGDVVVVSSAAGATGNVVGQLARLSGCRTIGIAGGPRKCAIARDYGFDECIDYKSEPVKHRLRELSPAGVNVFFDNVGGSILNEVLACIALRARVVLCGGISRYELQTPPAGPGNYFKLCLMRGSMTGFLSLDFAKHFPEARMRIAAWLRAGQLRVSEDILEGFDEAPAALIRLYDGQNAGRQLLKLADPPLPISASADAKS